METHGMPLLTSILSLASSVSSILSSMKKMNISQYTIQDIFGSNVTIIN